jgi:hypothetical protein
MSDNELTEMQREWRASVASSIHSTEAKVDLLLAKMNAMQLEYVRHNHFDAIATRVAALEGDRQKVIGAAVLLNALGAIVLYLITKFWK